MVYLLSKTPENTNFNYVLRKKINWKNDLGKPTKCGKLSQTNREQKKF